jgi:hypothetical protein
MKMMKLDDFLKMPNGTVFQKYESHQFGQIQILGERVGTRDFLSNESLEMPIGGEGLDEELGAIETMIATGSSHPVQFDDYARDGYLKEDQIYAVWEKDDLTGLIAMLRQSL